jgi:hypothetical protein
MGRLALGGLFGDKRLRVYPDGRIEGIATLSPKMLHAPKRTPERERYGAPGGIRTPDPQVRSITKA